MSVVTAPQAAATYNVDDFFEYIERNTETYISRLAEAVAIPR